MLAIIAGLQRTGDRAAFQILQSILEANGHPQAAWRQETLLAMERTKTLRVGRQGSMEMSFSNSLWPVLKASGMERWHAMKTHGSLTPKCAAAIELGLVRVVTTWREPLEVAAELLSYTDNQIHTMGTDAVRFGHILTLRDAIDHVGDRLPQAGSWLEDERVLKVSWQKIMESPEEVCGAIARHLGLGTKGIANIAAAAGSLKADDCGAVRRLINDAHSSDIDYASDRFELYRSRLPER